MPDLPYLEHGAINVTHETIEIATRASTLSPCLF